MIDLPHGIIGWMWFLSLGNTIFHFGKALFSQGSWWVWVGSLVLSAFLKAVSRQAIAQDQHDKEKFLRDLIPEHPDMNEESLNVETDQKS